MTPPPAKPPRRTQADRRAATRGAILAAAARGISRDGYGSLVLERVASDAGFTRGALYHHFSDKEELALAVVEWSLQLWRAEVGAPAARATDPVEAMLLLARGHAVFCRREIAPLIMTLRVELGGSDHPVGQLIDRALQDGYTFVAGLVKAARSAGSLPDGPPPETVARAFVGAVEGLTIQLAGEPRYDEAMAERAARGVLGLPPDLETTP